MKGIEIDAISTEVSSKSLSLAASGTNGEKYLAVTPMLGACEWHGQPAYELNDIPKMIANALRGIERQGGTFAPHGAIVVVCRQHGTQFVDDNEKEITPELSWECSAPAAQAAALNRLESVQELVGELQARFAIPKAKWALEQEGDLRQRVRRIALTGDRISWWLTGEHRVGLSDAACNGICSMKGELATTVIRKAGLDAKWFAQPIRSGEVVGVVTSNNRAPRGVAEITRRISGWKVGAPLADNDASCAGCGLFNDDSVILESLGTSGTGMRLVGPDDVVRGEVDIFEHFGKRLLLKMLHRCARFYDEFLERFAAGLTHGELNTMAAGAHPNRLMRVSPGLVSAVYPEGWNDLSLGEKVASAQASIVVEMLLRARTLLNAAPDTPVSKCVLTGGLSRSPFIRFAYHTGMKIIDPKIAIAVMSFRKKEERAFAEQTAVLGGLMSAISIASGRPIEDVARDTCSIELYEPPADTEGLDDFFHNHLRGTSWADG